MSKIISLPIAQYKPIMSRLHSCSECNWCYPLTDSESETLHICVNRYSDCFLQEVGLCSEDCELDDFAEKLWCEEHGVEYFESEEKINE